MNLQEMIMKNVKFRDILGEHSGVINEISIQEKGIFVYVISFGQNVWLDVRHLDDHWWIVDQTI